MEPEGKSITWLPQSPPYKKKTGAAYPEVHGSIHATQPLTQNQGEQPNLLVFVEFGPSNFAGICLKTCHRHNDPASNYDKHIGGGPFLTHHPL